MFKNILLICLTHTLQPDVPTWDGSCGFKMHLKMDYDKGCRVQGLTMNAGIGTHMDAPMHFVPGAADIAELPLDTLCVPVVVINVEDKAHPDYLILPDDVVSFEKQYGKIPSGCFIIGYTGWSKQWSDIDAYRNVDAHGMMHFPSWSLEAAKLLLERDVVGIGIDTLSPDVSDMTFPVHHAVLGAGKYLLENVAHADQLPPHGAFALVMPLKMAGATESPVRLVGLVPN